MHGSSKLDADSPASARRGQGYLGTIVLAVALQAMCVSTSSARGSGEGDEHWAVRHHVRAQAKEPEHEHVYFRPFCRRSRYVTNPSAPCYN